LRKYLSARELTKLKKPGRYAVGENVYLQISQWRTRSWIFRYIRDGRARHLGLGAFDLLTLGEARERGHALRRQLLDGIDPLQAKRAAKRQQMLASIHAKTFKDCGLAYIAAHESGWRGDHSRQQWSGSLAKYVYPKIGNMAVSDVDLASVLSVLEPIWTSVPETARRVRNRIELILDWATARGLRTGDNPARWKGLLESLLPDQRRANGVKHFPALDYRIMGAFMQKLRADKTIVARALEFAILTAARPGETVRARWSEIDGNVWTLPPERMKNHREHRVPLSRRAVELLSELPRGSDEYLFPALRTGEGAMDIRNFARLLATLGHGDVTAHGFRSSFSDWAGERTAYAPHVVELALAHTIGNAVERAYRRGDLFDQRRQLMDAWARYCRKPDTANGAVVPLRKGA